MSRLFIQADAGELGDRPLWSTEISEGEEVTFGRGSSRLPVTVTLDDPAVSRLAGRIHSRADCWDITNLSRSATYVVEDPDSGGYLKVAPGRYRAPVPFELARVRIPTRTGSVCFLVFAPDHAYDTSETPLTGKATVPAFSLDRTSKYFRVLVALCEPQLRDRASVVIPSVPQIIDRLGGLIPTEAAVYFHINYLARTKLRIREPDLRTSGKADWQRFALVSTALRYDLVREEDLRMLPVPRTTRPPRVGG